jgi:hypothetical protein
MSTILIIVVLVLLLAVAADTTLTAAMAARVSVALLDWFLSFSWCSGSSAALAAWVCQVRIPNTRGASALREFGPRIDLIRASRVGPQNADGRREEPNYSFTQGGKHGHVNASNHRHSTGCSGRWRLVRQGTLVLD